MRNYRNNATNNTAASVGGETKADVDMNASVAEGVDEDKSKRTRKKSTSIITKEGGGGEALEPLPPKPPMTNRETFSVNILTAGFWPSAAKLDVVLPPELQSLRDDFESYYLEQYTGRRLAWQHSTSTCVLAITAPWSARVYAVARETHGRVCPLCYLLPVWVRPPTSRIRAPHQSSHP